MKATLSVLNFSWRGMVVVLFAGTMLSLVSCSKSSNSNPTSPDNGVGIGPNGGTVTSADGAVTVVIPAGALSSNQNIAITRSTDSNTCPLALGSAYSLTPNGLTFSKAVSLTLPYDSILDGANAALIGVAYQDDRGNWYGVTGGSIDTIRHTVTVPTTHFSKWSDYTTLEVIPSSTVVFTGQSLGFQVDQNGTPATAPAGQPFALVNPIAIIAAEWKVNGVVGGNTAVGTLDDFQGQDVLYTAPKQMPTPNLVTLTANVVSGSDEYTIPAFIHVVAQNWKLTLGDTITFPCAGAWYWNYGSGGYMDFQLDVVDNTVTAFPWFPDAPLENSGICPGATNVASVNMTWPSKGATINAITGAYDPNTNTMKLNIDYLSQGFPGMNITFNDGTPPVQAPVSQGTDFKQNSNYHNLSATQVIGFNNGISNVQFTLTALPQ